LHHILEQARRAEARVLSLEVRVSNRAAQGLYRSFGFREVGIRPKYYADNGEDALLMDLELPP
jgi:ribosomal-protein-alanine N-acetyltransferase